MEVEEHDELWDDIQLAERYLVSAMYSCAADTASSVLKRLALASPKTRNLLNLGPGAAEQAEAERVREMVEAAGMVLLQATSELGRLGSLFSVLKEHFGSIEFIPHYLFLPGVCLQVSAQIHYSAQLALETFLSGWSTARTTDENCGKDLLSKVSEVCTIYLPRNVYGDLAEIYALHVLAKGRKNPELAVAWTKHADLLESRRQDILQKLFPILQLQKEGKGAAPTTRILESKPDQERLDTCNSDPDLQIKETILASTKTTMIQASRIGFGYWFKILLKVLDRMWMQIQAYPSRVSNHSVIVMKGITGSTFAFILIYAFIRERHLIRRVVKASFRRIQGILTDFWELAFGLQLNPLAAVQPLPSARH